jgi:sarcosine oxidase, subunit alpha
MAEVSFARRSPLASYVDRFTAAGRDDTVRLREIPFLSMMEVRGPVPPTADGLTLSLGPDWWLLLGSSDPSGVDVSAQRTTLELRGPRVRDVLMTGCALDLETFPTGACAQTLLAQAQVVLYRVGDAIFWILVRASFAGYLADWLLDAMVEHQPPSEHRPPEHG